MSSSGIELELFRHLLVSIAEEMGVVLRKTSYSANIKERRDYSCAVYDARGEAVAMGDHMPVHLGAMPLSVRAAMVAFVLQEGDVVAQLAAIQRGERGLREFVAKHGESRVNRNMRAIQDYSARMMQAAIRKLPGGVYRFEDFLDNDGITAEPVRIRVAVTIAKGRAVVDFTGSAPQVQGSVNANFAVTLAATMYVFRCLIEDDVPFTAGILRPIRLIAPEGSVVNALPPAAMAAGNVETS